MSVVMASMMVTASMASVAGATSSATGNASAIALYAKAVKATNALPVLRDTSTDTYFLQDNIQTLSNPATFAFVLKEALPKTPGGFVDAKTVTTFRLSGGIIKWMTTLVLPDCGTTTACKDSVGLEFYDTPTEEKVALLTGAASKYCWAQSQSHSLASFAFMPNKGVWIVNGKYSPIEKIGTQTLFKSTYSDNGIPITETDSLSNATHHFDKSTYHYAATGQILADSITVTETDPTTVPTAPNFPACTS
jgi:hypothetical protein